MCMCTIPNLVFAIIAISMRKTTPTHMHMKQLKRLLRYLNDARSMSITYGMPSHDNAYDIKVFSESD
jgi:hypothetical protein